MLGSVLAGCYGRNVGFPRGGKNPVVLRRCYGRVTDCDKCHKVSQRLICSSCSRCSRLELSVSLRFVRASVFKVFQVFHVWYAHEKTPGLPGFRVA